MDTRHTPLLKRLREHATVLGDAPRDYDPLLQLAQDRNMVLLGGAGHVTAARDGDGPAERRRVLPARKGSWEHLLHASGRDRFFLPIAVDLVQPLSELDELLSLVMDVAELTHTETASILLVNRSTGQLHFAASTRGEVLQDIVVPLDNSIAGWVVRHGRSLILDDVQTDERFYANVDEDLAFVTRSMLAVPLVTSQGIIGALEVINKQDDAHYTGQDVALMEALASQSAVAIMDAHLFSQSDLIDEIMHEIKTPLMAISAASELLTRHQAGGVDAGATLGDPALHQLARAQAACHRRSCD